MKRLDLGLTTITFSNKKYQSERKQLICFDEMANELDDQNGSYVATITCNNYLSTQVPWQAQDFCFGL